MIDALQRATQAVVGVQVGAAEGARSAETLGRQREGSGVVIGPDGLILTIGYLMLEADSIQVVTQPSAGGSAPSVALQIVPLRMHISSVAAEFAGLDNELKD